VRERRGDPQAAGSALGGRDARPRGRICHPPSMVPLLLDRSGCRCAAPTAARGRVEAVARPRRRHARAPVAVFFPPLLLLGCSAAASTEQCASPSALCGALTFKRPPRCRRRESTTGLLRKVAASASSRAPQPSSSLLGPPPQCTRAHNVPPVVDAATPSARGSQRLGRMQLLLRDTYWRRSSPPLPASSLSFLQAAMQMGKPLETV
jgi:hypothetical protein